MYEIIFSKKSQKQFNKLSKDVRYRIGRTFQRVIIRPHAHIKKLVGSKLYSLRVGDYRIILDIHEGKLIILIIEIGHRKNIYGKM